VEALVSLKLWIVFPPDGEKLKLIGEILNAEADTLTRRDIKKNAKPVLLAWLPKTSFNLLLC